MAFRWQAIDGQLIDFFDPRMKCYCCHMVVCVLCLFLRVLWVGLWSVIAVLPGPAKLLPYPEPCNRVPTVREKSVKNEKSSRSGKSQGILN